MKDPKGICKTFAPGKPVPFNADLFQVIMAYWATLTDQVDPAPPGLGGTPPYYPFLLRQTDCSITQYVIDSNETIQSQNPDYQDQLHSHQGIPTTGDQFPNGCQDPTTGISSQVGAFVNTLPNGNRVIAAVSADGVLATVITPTGTIASFTDYPTITQGPTAAVVGIATGDLNGNGIPDVVVSSLTSATTGTLSVFLNNGDGTFTAGQVLTVALPTGNDTPLGFTIEDVNGDSKLDLVASTTPTSTVSGITTFLGKGDGTFPTSGISGPVNAGGSFVISADFNGDGKKDLATSQGQILLGNGDGTFQLQSQTLSAGLVQRALAAADFNKDGKIDLAFVNSSTWSVDVYYGNGDGTFTYSISYPTVTGAGTDLQASDLDGDGYPDLFVGSAHNGAYTADSGTQSFFQSLLNHGDGTFGPGRAYISGSFSSRFWAAYDVADFTGDNKLDIVRAGSSDNTFSGSPVLQVLKGAGDGTFPSPGVTTSLSGPSTPGDLVAVAAGDVNGDGKQDVVFAWGTTISTALGNGDGTFQAEQDYSIPAAVLNGTLATYNPLVLADVNGDGKPDIVFLTQGSPTSLYVMLNNGDGTFQSAQLIDSQPFMTYLAVGDINGDGKPDVAVSTGDWASSTKGNGLLYLGKGNGTFQSAVTLNPNIPYPQPVAIADMNGDGKPDLVFAGVESVGGDTDVSILLGNGDGTFQTAAKTQLSSAQDLVGGMVIADSNLDGKPDVILGLSSLFVVLGNGDGTLNASESSYVFLGISNFSNQGQELLKSANLTSNGLPSLLLDGMNTLQVYPATQPVAPPAATTTTLQASATTLTAGQSVTFTATVARQSGSGTPTGTVNFLDGSTTIGSGALNASGVATFSTTSLSTGPHSITASYGGDANFAASTSSAASVTVNGSGSSPDFTLGAAAASPASATINAGQTATFTITVAPTGGFSGTVNLSCSGAPTGATCAANPASLNVMGGNAATSTLQVTTTARSLLPTAERIPPFDARGLMLALLLGAPLALFAGRKRLACSVVLLVVILLTGCSGGKNTSKSGTPVGAYALTITATSGSVSHNTQVTLTVN